MIRLKLNELELYAKDALSAFSGYRQDKEKYNYYRSTTCEFSRTYLLLNSLATNMGADFVC